MISERALSFSQGCSHENPSSYTAFLEMSGPGWSDTCATLTSEVEQEVIKMIYLAVVCFYDCFYFFFNVTLRVVPSHLKISQIEVDILGEKMLLVLECDAYCMSTTSGST